MWRSRSASMHLATMVVCCTFAKLDQGGGSLDTNLTSWTVWVEGRRGTYDVRLNAENKLFIRRHIGSTIYFR